MCIELCMFGSGFNYIEDSENKNSAILWFVTIKTA